MICTYSEEKIFCTGPIRAAKAEQKSLVPARQAQEPTKEKDPFHLLFESLFTSVLAVSRTGYPSLVSLVITSTPPTSTSSFDIHNAKE
jgi:hypothetical protein